MDNGLVNQVMPDEQFNEQEANKFMLYMKKCYPKFHEQYGAGPGVASGSNALPGHVEYQRAAQSAANGNGHLVVIKPEEKKDEKATVLVKENAELYERTGKLEGELATLRAESKAIHYERRLHTIDPEGQTLDLKAELADLRTMTDAQVESHFKRLERAAQYSRSPVGQGFVRVDDAAETAAQARANAPVTHYEKQAAIDLCTERQEAGKPITFAEAVAEIRKK